LNKDTFIKLVKEPDSISVAELASLDEVLKSFSFCNTANILVAKGNFDKGSMFSNQKVKRAALFAPSREVLKKLIHAKTTSLPEPTQNIASTTSSSATLKVENESLVLESIPNRVKEVYEQLEELKNHIIDEKSIDQEVLVVSSFDTSAGNEILDSIIAEKKTFEGSDNSSQPLKFYVHSREFGKDIRKAQVDLISEYLAYRSAKVVEVPDLETQNQIIQKFITDAPQLSKPAAMPLPIANVDLSKKSTTEDFELVTETFANILVKQEKYKKAIEAYEKLILKYPDKSTYFAEKIALVKSLIK